MKSKREFEYALAYHCAPSILGIKAADLFSWPREGEQEIAVYADALRVRGIALRVLRRSQRRVLLMVYRPSCLERCLACSRVQQMLEQEGYPVHSGTETLLEDLSRRLDAQDFPHEIGLFLGYPPEDVEGFCRCKGQNFKACGRWKVYGDQQAAERYFACCDLCRDLLCSRLVSCPLLELLQPPVAGKGA